MVSAPFGDVPFLDGLSFVEKFAILVITGERLLRMQCRDHYSTLTISNLHVKEQVQTVA